MPAALAAIAGCSSKNDTGPLSSGRGPVSTQLSSNQEPHALRTPRSQELGQSSQCCEPKANHRYNSGHVPQAPLAADESEMTLPLTALREGWDEAARVVETASGPRTAAEGIEVFRQLYLSLAAQLHCTEDLFGEDRLRHLALLQQRLLSLADWQKAHGAGPGPERGDVDAVRAKRFGECLPSTYRRGPIRRITSRRPVL
jgi:hypothetical protein